eukprot:6185780-Pleurochrysis_carterae.AAC.8
MSAGSCSASSLAKRQNSVSTSRSDRPARAASHLSCSWASAAPAGSGGSDATASSSSASTARVSIAAACAERAASGISEQASEVHCTATKPRRRSVELPSCRSVAASTDSKMKLTMLRHRDSKRLAPASDEIAVAAVEGCAASDAASSGDGDDACDDASISKVMCRIALSRATRLRCFGGAARPCSIGGSRPSGDVSSSRKERRVSCSSSVGAPRRAAMAKRAWRSASRSISLPAVASSNSLGRLPALRSWASHSKALSTSAWAWPPEVGCMPNAAGWFSEIESGSTAAHTMLRRTLSSC